MRGRCGCGCGCGCGSRCRCRGRRRRRFDDAWALRPLARARVRHGAARIRQAAIGRWAASTVTAVVPSRNGTASEKRVWGRRRPRTTRHMTVRLIPNPSHQCRSWPRRVRRWSITTRTQPPAQSMTASCPTRVMRLRLELDNAFDDANYSDESIPTFSSSKMIAECDDAVCVAAFPAPPVVEKEEATEVDWAAATPPPHLWPKDLGDLFANNPGGARTWDEVEAAMHRLVLYHAVRGTIRFLSLSWRAARDAPRSRARTHARTHHAVRRRCRCFCSHATKRYPRREWYPHWYLRREWYPHGRAGT